MYACMCEVFLLSFLSVIQNEIKQSNHVKDKLYQNILYKEEDSEEEADKDKNTSCVFVCVCVVCDIIK